MSETETAKPTEGKKRFDPGPDKKVYTAKFLHETPSFVGRQGSVAKCNVNMVPVETWTQGEATFSFCEVQMSARAAADKIRKDQDNLMSGPDMFHLHDSAERTRMVVWALPQEEYTIQVYCLAEDESYVGKPSLLSIRDKTNDEIMTFLVNKWRTCVSDVVERTVIHTPEFHASE